MGGLEIYDPVNVQNLELGAIRDSLKTSGPAGEGRPDPAGRLHPVGLRHGLAVPQGRRVELVGQVLLGRDAERIFTAVGLSISHALYSRAGKMC